MQFDHFLNNEQHSLQIGMTLATCVQKPALILLEGDLGSGKTTLVRGFLQGLGFNGKVKSPSYTLVESYEVSSTLIVHHCDFYRLTSAASLAQIGFEEYFDAENAIILVEWPEKVGKTFLSSPDIRCLLKPNGLGRDLTLVAESERARAWLGAFVSRQPEA